MATCQNAAVFTLILTLILLIPPTVAQPPPSAKRKCYKSSKEIANEFKEPPGDTKAKDWADCASDSQVCFYRRKREVHTGPISYARDCEAPSGDVPDTIGLCADLGAKETDQRGLDWKCSCKTDGCNLNPKIELDCFTGSTEWKDLKPCTTTGKPACFYRAKGLVTDNDEDVVDKIDSSVERGCGDATNITDLEHNLAHSCKAVDPKHALGSGEPSLYECWCSTSACNTGDPELQFPEALPDDDGVGFLQPKIYIILITLSTLFFLFAMHAF